MKRGSVCYLFALLVASAGCEGQNHGGYTGKTVGAFTGALVHNGQPVSFPEGANVTMPLMHESGRRYIIPIKPDGTFTIGWMPIGKYSATLNRPPAAPPGEREPRLPAFVGGYSIPGGLTIEDGKTQYLFELGPDWKP